MPGTGNSFVSRHFRVVPAMAVLLLAALVGRIAVTEESS